ncbi:hypothetical protein DFQ28_009402 [Apophysomyces sp. BC1034]|nr:hypothetical protein DFQ30_008080 [Apophysomyces sp. BC1015]KAG0173146.1 hypothetical protein DFQ29_008064 [Apophysomyces sp. BC1021]KAG0185394.1 hypothetical protein DFQ28_009402 [Apophysomyces sp. BC1034]
MCEPNFICIYDNSAAANLIYLSESVTDVLGWTPEEMISKGGYEYFHPDDHFTLKQVHLSNVMNERMSSMVSYRFKHKNGSYVTLETVVHHCHDILVTTNFIHDVTSATHKMRFSSVDEVLNCMPDGTLQGVGAWNLRQEHMKETLDVDYRWIGNEVVHSQEPRFCLILNRYTEELTVVFASQLISRVVTTAADVIVGHSLYEFIHERDRSVAQAHMALVKEYGMVVRLRFDWLQDDDLAQAVEAIVSCTNDGIVMVLRQTPRLLLSKHLSQRI